MNAAIDNALQTLLGRLLDWAGRHWKLLIGLALVYLLIGDLIQYLATLWAGSQIAKIVGAVNRVFLTILDFVKRVGPGRALGLAVLALVVFPPLGVALLASYFIGRKVAVASGAIMEASISTEP